MEPLSRRDEVGIRFGRELCFVNQLFLDLYITYTKFYKFLFLVSISLGFKTINWLKTSLSRFSNRLIGQARLLYESSRAFKKSL